jgi:hypothetical protein
MAEFDGAKHFGFVSFVVLGSALLCTPYLGCWGWLPAAMTLYFALVFFNRLEERDLMDFQGATRPRRRSR